MTGLRHGGASALVFLAAIGAAAAGCAGPRERADESAENPGYLAAGPTVGLEGGGDGRPTALELLDRRNRELEEARRENAALAADKARLEADGARLATEAADLRARLEASERAASAAAGELESMKQALVRSRLMNVRLGQHLARLDLGIEEEGDPVRPEGVGAVPEPGAEPEKEKRGDGEREK